MSIIGPNTKISYPDSREELNVSDKYHGTMVKDPYRWLEDDRSPETAGWVELQNAVTEKYLNQIPFRDEIRTRYRELLDYPRMSSPLKVGDYYFFYKNTGLQNQPVIYRQKGLSGNPEVFLDANAHSQEGTISFQLGGASKDDQYICYFKQTAGSDWMEAQIKKVATGITLPDLVQHIKFSGTNWYQDGFFYSRYPEPNEANKFSDAHKFHSVYYHRIGTNQAEDELIFNDHLNPNHIHSIAVTEDQKYLILTKSSGTNGYETYYRHTADKGKFIPLFTGFDHKNLIIDHNEGCFLVLTDIGAPRYRLVRIDLHRSAREHWHEVIPESEDYLRSVSSAGGKLFANYLRDAITKIYQFNLDGSAKTEINTPGLGNVEGFQGKKTDKLLFYTFTSFLYPPTIFTYDMVTGESSPFYETPLKYDPQDYDETQVFYESKDGLDIPMFIVAKKGISRNGDNPAYLYGYGGFNVSLTPNYHPWRILLLEQSGVYIQANIRGGGEYGERWHQAGMLLQKQNCFDDFLTAAKYLIENKYTSSSKLAIAGGSNGGLLVGACMTQAPELFAVAFPAVGVLDMLRYHRFTIGHAWVVEYGSSEDAEHFENLLNYSPLHNLKLNTKYPSTLIFTADHDDRVVPAHSFKFAAQLQKCHSGNNPVLIRIEKQAGHGVGKPIHKILAEGTDRMAFFLFNTSSQWKSK